MDVSGTDATTRRLLHVRRALLPVRPHSSLQLVQCAYQPMLKINQKIQDDDVPYPLTEEEAFSFLENILGIDKPRELLKRDCHKFLDTLTILMNVKLPFTNIHMVSEQDVISISFTSLQECKEAIVKLYGGNCFYINMFTKALLDVLGFKTFHVGASNPSDAQFDSHVSTILCDLTYPGSQHLVDPGTIRPLYKAISLDFEKESPIYQFNYMKVKFFKRDHGILLSCSQVPEPKTPSPIILEHKGCFWKVELIYRLQVLRSRTYWLERMKYIHHFPSIVPQLFKSVLLFGHIGDKCVRLSSTGEMFGMKYNHPDPSQEERILLTRDEFLAIMEKEFPQYPRKMIENALVNTKYGQNMYNY